MLHLHSNKASKSVVDTQLVICVRCRILWVDVLSLNSTKKQGDTDFLSHTDDPNIMIEESVFRAWQLLMSSWPRYTARADLEDSLQIFRQLDDSFRNASQLLLSYYDLALIVDKYQNKCKSTLDNQERRKVLKNWNWLSRTGNFMLSILLAKSGTYGDQRDSCCHEFGQHEILY